MDINKIRKNKFEFGVKRFFAGKYTSKLHIYFDHFATNSLLKEGWYFILYINVLDILYTMLFFIIHFFHVQMFTDSSECLVASNDKQGIPRIYFRADLPKTIPREDLKKTFVQFHYSIPHFAFKIGEDLHMTKLSLYE